MNLQEIKTNGLFMIAGMLIGLAMWFTYDRIEGSVQLHKAEKYFARLNGEGVEARFEGKGDPVSYESIRILDHNGNPVAVQPDPGRVVILSIWASWDIPCIENLPALASLYEKTKREVDFYLLTGEDPAKVMRIMKNQDLDMPCYFFTHRDDLPCFLQQAELPYTCIIHQGEIRCEYSGMAPWDCESIIHFIEKLQNPEKRLTNLITFQRIEVLNVINFQ